MNVSFLDMGDYPVVGSHSPTANVLTTRMGLRNNVATFLGLPQLSNDAAEPVALPNSWGTSDHYALPSTYGLLRFGLAKVLPSSSGLGPWAITPWFLEVSSKWFSPLNNSEGGLFSLFMIWYLLTILVKKTVQDLVNL